MNLLLDTNILVSLSKDPSFHLLNNIVNPYNHLTYVSIASVGELRSIALQNNWGERKWGIVNGVMRQTAVIEISEVLALTYAQIDAFSQRKHPDYNRYPFPTPRNMAKNDLWIAATAAFLGLKLITTDADFDHLHTRFFEVERLSPDIFKPKHR